jgi:hypothetical protein
VHTKTNTHVQGKIRTRDQKLMTVIGLGVDYTRLRYTLLASEFSYQLLGEQRVTSDAQLHAGMQTLDSWRLAQTNAFDIWERNWRILALYHVPLSGRTSYNERVYKRDSKLASE